jgi:hypothetical protein
MDGAVIEVLCVTGGIGAVPEIGHTINLRRLTSYPDPAGFHRANCVDAAAVAATMLPAAMVVVHAGRVILKTFPRRVFS